MGMFGEDDEDDLFVAKPAPKSEAVAVAAPAKEAVFDDEDDLFGAKPAPAAEAPKEEAPKAVPVVARVKSERESERHQSVVAWGPPQIAHL